MNSFQFIILNFKKTFQSIRKSGLPPVSLKAKSRKPKADLGGYSLVELLVAVSIFIIVALVSISALISINDANKKAQSMRAVIDNLNFVMEGMARNLRVGTTYHCFGFNSSVSFESLNLDWAEDCVSGKTAIAFEAYNGDPSSPNDQIIYALNDNGQIIKSTNSGDDFLPLTPHLINEDNPEVLIPSDLQPLTIDYLRFYVTGAGTLSDQVQPRIIIVVGGTARYDQKIQTTFQIQTSVSQRQIDS